MHPSVPSITPWRIACVPVPSRGEAGTRRACRALAARLLAAAGAPTCEVGRGTRGEPVWPHGYVGSIAHARGLGVVALARTTECSALGVDVEEIAPLEDGLLDVVATRSERAFVLAAEGAHRDRRARLLFTAKEALYKALPAALQERAEPTDLGVRFASTEDAFVAGVAGWPEHGTWVGSACSSGDFVIAVAHRPSSVRSSTGDVP